MTQRTTNDNDHRAQIEAVSRYGTVLETFFGEHGRRKPIRRDIKSSPGSVFENTKTNHSLRPTSVHQSEIMASWSFIGLLVALAVATAAIVVKWRFRPHPVPGIPHHPITSIWGDMPALGQSISKHGAAFEPGAFFDESYKKFGPVFQVSDTEGADCPSQSLQRSVSSGSVCKCCGDCRRTRGGRYHTLECCKGP